MKLSNVVELIRGNKGSEVRLTIIPADAPNSSVRKLVTLIRDEIKLEDSAAKARIYEIPQGNAPAGQEQVIRLGVIDLPSFYSGFELEGRRTTSEQKSTTIDVAKLLKKLVKERVSGVVLDLRRNGGGSLEEAINLTGLFIKDGPVVQVRDFDSRIFLDTDPDSSVWYDGPLIVLTSRFSASASLTRLLTPSATVAMTRSQSIRTPRRRTAGRRPRGGEEGGEGRVRAAARNRAIRIAWGPTRSMFPILLTKKSNRTIS